MLSQYSFHNTPLKAVAGPHSSRHCKKEGHSRKLFFWLFWFKKHWDTPNSLLLQVSDCKVGMILCRSPVLTCCSNITNSWLMYLILQAGI